MHGYTQLYIAIHSYISASFPAARDRSSGGYFPRSLPVPPLALRARSRSPFSRQNPRSLWKSPWRGKAIHGYPEVYIAIYSINIYTWLYTAINSYTQLYISIHSYTQHTWLYTARHGYTKAYTAIHSWYWGILKVEK